MTDLGQAGFSEMSPMVEPYLVENVIGCGIVVMLGFVYRTFELVCRPLNS